MNEVLAHNIYMQLKQLKKKQTDLAENLGISKQTVNKMLNGGRTITAPELKQIADYLEVPMEELVKISDSSKPKAPLKAFMGRVSSTQGKEGIKIAEKLIQIYLFHAKYQKEAFKTWRNEEWSDE
jgi:DNA-binding Xre family transcriptional regulator